MDAQGVLPLLSVQGISVGHHAFPPIGWVHSFPSSLWMFGVIPSASLVDIGSDGLCHLKLLLTVTTYLPVRTIPFPAYCVKLHFCCSRSVLTVVCGSWFWCLHHFRYTTESCGITSGFCPWRDCVTSGAANHFHVNLINIEECRLKGRRSLQLGKEGNGGWWQRLRWRGWPSGCMVHCSKWQGPYIRARCIMELF